MCRGMRWRWWRRWCARGSGDEVGVRHTCASRQLSTDRRSEFIEASRRTHMRTALWPLPAARFAREPRCHAAMAQSHRGATDQNSYGAMSMHMQHRQKQHERFLLEQFFDYAEIRAEIIDEREAPDFFVQYEGRRIGVEVTQLFISCNGVRNPIQAQESISTRIVSRARQIYDDSGGLPAHVSVCFNPGHDLRKLNRNGTANDLAAFVRTLKLTEWQRLDWRPEDFEGPLPDEISFVSALGVPDRELAHWTVALTGWAAPVTVDALQRRVDEKAKCLPKYRETVGENWLVIIADATKPSGLFDTRSHIDPEAVSSPFSRTYFYGYPDRVVMSLGIKG